MTGKTSLADFEALVRRAGMKLAPAQIAQIYPGWGYVEEYLERIRQPPLPRAAEPMHIFRPEGT